MNQKMLSLHVIIVTLVLLFKNIYVKKMINLIFIYPNYKMSFAEKQKKTILESKNPYIESLIQSVHNEILNPKKSLVSSEKKPEVVKYESSTDDEGFEGWCRDEDKIL